MVRFRFLDPCVMAGSLALAACGSNATSPSPEAPDAAQDVGLSGADAGLAEGSSDAPDALAVSSPDSGGGEGGVDGAAFVMAPHPAWPQIPLKSTPGTLLKPMKLVSIVVQGEPLAQQLFAFGDALVQSAWWITVGQDYGLGASAMTNTHVTGPTIPQNTTRADPGNPGSTDMENYIQSLILTNATPPRDDNTMYLLYLPPGIAAYDDKAATSNTTCQLYGGYHSVFPIAAADGGTTTNGVVWGFAQRCGPSQGAADLGTLTLTASHEVVEAATDAIPGYGYTFAAAIPPVPPPSPWTQTPWLALGGEVGDLCESTQWTEGSYTYQRIWSNSAATSPGDPCVPAYPSVPYVNASAPQEWYSVAAGASVQIPLTGFSDRPTGDWSLTTFKTQGNDSGSRLTSVITSPTMAGTTPTTNNGRSATMTVSAASGTPSGTWTLIEITSWPQASSGGDKSHFWLVGVYVK